MFDDVKKLKKIKEPKKITKQRLKNIALYYLRRFETSVGKLRQVLQNRVNDYAFFDKEFDKAEAYDWVEEIVGDFQRYGYVDDQRFTEIKIRDYVNAGKSQRYIVGKLKEKGVEAAIIDAAWEKQEYNEYDTALKFAQKKHIGPYRSAEKRQEFKQKDMGALVRAGFSYDVVLEVLATDIDE